jgi:hypothetical protein
MVRVWARYSDRMRANPIIAFIVSDPRNQGGKLDHFGADDTGGSAQCPTGRTFCVGLTLKRIRQTGLLHPRTSSLRPDIVGAPEQPKGYLKSLF